MRWMNMYFGFYKYFRTTTVACSWQSYCNRSEQKRPLHGELKAGHSQNLDTRTACPSSCKSITNMIDADLSKDNHRTLFWLLADYQHLFDFGAVTVKRTSTVQHHIDTG